jgi:hypothetical protein
MHEFRELLSAVEAGTRFLDRYVHGGRGFTSQDVRTGILRLEGMCRQIEQAEAPGKELVRTGTVMVEAARLCVSRARERLSGAEPA